MMIGHWFLVDPTISKKGMKRIALFTTFQPLIIIPLVYLNYLSEDIGDIYKLVIMFLYLSTGILSFASYKSLNEFLAKVKHFLHSSTNKSSSLNFERIEISNSSGFSN